jgi:hypothetical protein
MQLLRLFLLLLLLLFLAMAAWLVWRHLKPSQEPGKPVAVATAPPASIPPEPLPRVVRELPRIPGAPDVARRVVMQRLALLGTPAAEQVERLRPAATAGDPTSAYELAMLLSDCSEIPVDPAELERRIETVRRTRRNVDTAVRYPEQMAADLHRQFDRCRGVSAEQRASYYDWLLKAADAGQLDALENFELFVPPGDICRQYDFSRCSPAEQAASRAAREVIARYLLAARDAGSANALWQLGAAYLNNELFAENDTAAYAHLLAYQRVSRAFGIADRVAALVGELRGRLRPGDLAAASQQARALLANPNCCVLIQ